MKFALLLVVFAGCSALTRIENPVSPGYPCGTRAHACSVEPLTCCWNGEVCGAEGTSCPAGACCYRGESYGAPQFEAGKDGGR